MSFWRWLGWRTTDATSAGAGPNDLAHSPVLPTAAEVAGHSPATTNKNKKDGKVVVLSVDGGGLRGVLPATIIDRINRVVPFLDEVDVFAGTSTGAIVAVALAAGYTPQAVIELYERMAPEIFAHSFSQDIKDLEGLVGSAYQQGQVALKEHLFQTFGDMTIGQLPRKVIFPTFDLGDVGDASTGRPFRRWQPRYITNFGLEEDKSKRIVDCILLTSAAPTYFPSYQNCIDGGIVANNPSMVALSHVVAGGQVALEKVVMLSLGTGLFSQCLKGPTHDWGVFQWAPHLLDIIFDGTSEEAAQQCMGMLGEHKFRRINPRLATKIGLDRLDAVSQLRTIGAGINIRDDCAWLRSALGKKKADDAEEEDEEEWHGRECDNGEEEAAGDGCVHHTEDSMVGSVVVVDAASLPDDV